MSAAGLLLNSLKAGLLVTGLSDGIRTGAARLYFQVRKLLLDVLLLCLGVVLAAGGVLMLLFALFLQLSDLSRLTVPALWTAAAGFAAAGALAWTGKALAKRAFVNPAKPK